MKQRQGRKGRVVAGLMATAVAGGATLGMGWGDRWSDVGLTVQQSIER